MSTRASSRRRGAATGGSSTAARTIPRSGSTTPRPGASAPPTPGRSRRRRRWRRGWTRARTPAPSAATCISPSARCTTTSASTTSRSSTSGAETRSSSAMSRSTPVARSTWRRTSRPGSGKRGSTGLRGGGGSVSTAHLHRGDAALGHDPGRADPRVPPPRCTARASSFASPTSRRAFSVGGGSGLPAAAAALEREALEAAARGLPRLRRVRGPAPRRGTTDKLPENYRHLGLIAAMLPNARIVHVGRDPMDVCVSNYLVRFQWGHAWSYDFDSLACEYRAYERLMRHWRAVLPSPVHEQSYESLVASPGIGEPPAGRVLRARLGTSAASTSISPSAPCIPRAAGRCASRFYRRSVERWRNYERHLGPLREALGAGGSGGRGGRGGDGGGGLRALKERPGGPAALTMPGRAAPPMTG